MIKGLSWARYMLDSLSLREGACPERSEGAWREGIKPKVGNSQRVMAKF